MINNKYSVLYAEDEHSVRKMYVDVLKNYFGIVYEASNGIEALEIYKIHKPDLLILDINMPIMSGLEVAQKLRSENDNCKIIILSAVLDTTILIKACELYLIKYLVKPIKTLQLDAVLTQVICELDALDIEKESAVTMKFDSENMLIIDGVKEIKLSRKEFALIQLLFKNKGDLISSFDIINVVWENDFEKDYDPNKLRVLVYRLNKKLSTDIVLSAYNEGYYLSQKLF
ncbi:MAG: response regulator transcription factor [Arcobacteraceae bacterium]|jgi:DNA-binding response OmpR family regulator|nr:response regulator transcription factor [Arcobacteraceae bacterium]